MLYVCLFRLLFCCVVVRLFRCVVLFPCVIWNVCQFIILNLCCDVVVFVFECCFLFVFLNDMSVVF